MLPQLSTRVLAVGLAVGLAALIADSRAAATGERSNDKSPPSTVKVHMLAPNDVVELKVYRQPDLDTKARLAADGTVTLPLLGQVKIGGRTVEQARVIVQDLLAKDYLVNPQVTFYIVAYASNQFTVLGEVQRTGTYEMPADQSLNLLQALAMAGGYTRLGAPGKVTVQRIENGQKRVIRLDTNAMASDENSTLFEIVPGDIITVGEKVF